MACRAGITTDPEKEDNIGKACPSSKRLENYS